MTCACESFLNLCQSAAEVSSHNSKIFYDFHLKKNITVCYNLISKRSLTVAVLLQQSQVSA